MAQHDTAAVKRVFPRRHGGDGRPVVKIPMSRRLEIKTITGAGKGRVTVGLSGGVDSSVAALLLLQEGYRVNGLFMKNWQEQDPLHPCTAAEDARDAKSVCRHLGIEFSGVNFSTEYWQRVFRHFLDEFDRARTPNPDILCNKEIKFKAFLDHAMAQGADLIATGHYARIARHNGHYLLLKGADPSKDQSYFLYGLDQTQLSKVIFPLGDLSKTRVRRLAAQAGLATHDKKDSTGICFIGKRNFRRFLRDYFLERRGPICTLDGTQVGEHEGLVFYTIGQRQGLGIGGLEISNGKPWYVASKDPAANTLFVVQGHDHPALFSTTLTAGPVHWISGRPPQIPFRCQAKTRYRQPVQSCEITALGESRCRVVFDAPQWAVTPGQAVVFYREAVCLGGGTIESAALHDSGPYGLGDQ